MKQSNQRAAAGSPPLKGNKTITAKPSNPSIKKAHSRPGKPAPQKPAKPVTHVIVRPDKKGLFLPLRNGTDPDEAFIRKKGNRAVLNACDEKIELASTAISLLANSFMYGLGFTAVIDKIELFKLIAMDRSGKKCLINRDYTAAWEAREYIRAFYIVTAEGVIPDVPPLWTMFYHPGNKWLNKKLAAVPNQMKSGGLNEDSKEQSNTAKY